MDNLNEFDDYWKKEEAANKSYWSSEIEEASDAYFNNEENHNAMEFWDAETNGLKHDHTLKADEERCEAHYQEIKKHDTIEPLALAETNVKLQNSSELATSDIIENVQISGSLMDDKKLFEEQKKEEIRARIEERRIERHKAANLSEEKQVQNIFQQVEQQEQVLEQVLDQVQEQAQDVLRRWQYPNGDFYAKKQDEKDAAEYQSLAKKTVVSCWITLIMSVILVSEGGFCCFILLVVSIVNCINLKRSESVFIQNNQLKQYRILIGVSAFVSVLGLICNSID